MTIKKPNNDSLIRVVLGDRNIRTIIMEQLPFREVYKCSWLKLPQSEKKSAVSLPKQWVIFCVHNDSIPFLEVYVDEKMALTHKPNVSYQLTNVQHITPCICPHEVDEYEFVIAFPAEMIRLTASSQHQMMSWVNRLNVKLREMKLMAPSENLYTSHLSEPNRTHLLPTRDPNSPLPLPPPMAYIPPGVEPVSASSADGSDVAENTASVHNSTTVENSNSTSNSVTTNEVTTASTSSVSPSTSQDSNEFSCFNGGDGRANASSLSPRADTNITIINSDADGATSTGNGSGSSGVVSESGEGSLINNVTVIQVSSTSSANVFNFNNVLNELDAVQRADEELESTSSNGGGRCTNVGQASPRANDANLYEHVFLPSTSSNHGGGVGGGQPMLNTGAANPSPIISDNTRSAIAAVNVHHPSSSQLPKMGRGRGNVRGKRRNNSGSEAVSNHQSVAADRIRTAGPIVNPHQRLQPVPHPFVRQVSNDEATNNAQLTLREQQVMQLLREKSHPGGVRLQLRRNDCLNSIAFIDAFQSVWIAGWKQKEHPMLYTALHIGDQLISLSGKMVKNSADAQKLIRAWPSLYIEFVIRRIPCGRVYALRKESEGQNLGIVQENNTAEIREIISKSLAASQGLTSRVRTMNGLSWTTWYITEINGRPLNLFFKDNEVKDRLNAVGLDISLLIQPSDLVKSIKRQLKSIKNYKDYIIQ